MLERIKQPIRHILGRTWSPPSILQQLDDWDHAVLKEVEPFTMTGPERVYALTEAVRHVVRRDIPGAFAECGVWRGGSVLAIIRALQREGVTDRDIWLYDTFDGMTKPSQIDTSDFHEPALDLWNQSKRDGGPAFPNWFDREIFNLDLVKGIIHNAGYPPERIHFIDGDVHETLPASTPNRLALLRLDTDWYDSTRHEMQHLYPLLEQGGVLIIDDYGHWDGSRKAVDEYFASGEQLPVLLHRVDYTCRVAVKA